MRKNLTEIVFILDRSGSMSGLERDTIGGFNSMWIAIFMQLFLVALDKIIFRDYTYNSVIYHCYIGGVQNKRKWNDFRKYPSGSESGIFRKRI